MPIAFAASRLTRLTVTGTRSASHLKETPRPFRVVRHQVIRTHVAVVVESQVAVGHKHVVADEASLGAHPHGAEAGSAEPFEEGMGKNVAGTSREEDAVRKIPSPDCVLLDAWPQQVHGRSVAQRLGAERLAATTSTQPLAPGRAGGLLDDTAMLADARGVEELHFKRASRAFRA